MSIKQTFFTIHAYDTAAVTSNCVEAIYFILYSHTHYDDHLLCIHFQDPHASMHKIAYVELLKNCPLVIFNRWTILSNLKERILSRV